MTDNLLKFSANLDRNQLPANEPNSELSCNLSIKSDVASGDEVASTANICLVFDCSFSMAGKKFETAIKTAKMIVDMLHERHWISLVAFEIRSHVVFKNAVPTDEDKESIKGQIDNISNHLGGSTNMAAGIKTAMDVLSESVADAEVIVLLSDGVADSAEKAQMAADEASKRGIQIFAVGIGASYNTDQLLQLVTPSNGAVFGDSDEDKIGDIFYNIINRIDQIYASKVKLDFIFDEGVKLKKVYKTSPERALYNSLSINSEHMLDLRVGNIENNKVYEFLLQIEVASHEVGRVELIKARLQYDINHLGVVKQQEEEVILTVNYTEKDTLEEDTNKILSSAQKSASMVQSCDDLVQACSKSDNARAFKTIKNLQKRCDEENNTLLPHHLDNIKNKLENGNRITDKDRNDFLLACTIAPDKIEEVEIEERVEIDITPKVEALPVVIAPPVVEVLPEVEAPAAVEVPIAVIDAAPEVLPAAALYDFILVDPGTETIRLLREIRNTTSMGIPEIANIIKSRNSLVTAFKNLSDAEKFQQQLTKIGATVKIQVSGGVEADR